MGLFSAAAFFICLRESLEACIIVGIMLAYTRKTGFQRYNKWIWWGTGSAIAASIALGLGFGIAKWVDDDDIFAGRTRYIFEGVVSLLAAGLLTWMILWTTMMGHKLQQDIEDKLEAAIESGKEWKLFLLPFAQVFREGVETVVFILGVESNDGAESIPIPGVLGIVIALIVSVGVFRGSLKLDIGKFLRWTSVVLVFFAAGIASYGIHELAEANWFGSYKDFDNGGSKSKPDLERSWTGQTLWSTKNILHDKDNEVGGLMRALVGYQDTPTFMEIWIYALYWVLLLGAFHYLSVKVKSFTREHRNQHFFAAKIMTPIAFFWGFIQFIWACSVDYHPWNAFLVSIFGMIFYGAGTLALYNACGRFRLPAAWTYFVGCIVWHVFVLIIVLVQLDCNGKNKCGGFKDGFFYQLFWFNSDYFRGDAGLRQKGYWHAGAMLTMVWAINLFGGLFHGLWGYHLIEAIKENSLDEGPVATKAKWVSGDDVSTDKEDGRDTPPNVSEEAARDTTHV
ncbi:unnamed protein product [Pedinophyceae sp. YPF-701]|nr:unnamed protein product [Pedinophyceae sp. YPF-701]